jgi:Protein of unknown function (DUF3604)
VIKGWLDAKGEVQEKVYDVVWGDADKRKPGNDGKLPPVGSTVDVANAIRTNTIGDPELITVWKDPDFDGKQKAFYYARVIECRLQLNRRLNHFRGRFLQLNRRPTIIFAAKS